MAIFLANLTSPNLVLTVLLEIGFLVAMVTDVGASGGVAVASLDAGGLPPWQTTWLSERTDEVVVEMAESACLVVTVTVVVTTTEDG